MRTVMKAIAAAAGVVVAIAFVQPVEAGHYGKKFRGHHHTHFKGHNHFKGHWHGRHRGHVHRKPVRPFHRARRPSVRFLYVVPPPRRATVIERYAPPPAVSVAPPGAWAPATTCREYTKEVIVHGRPVAAYGRACLQPDGSWRLVPAR